MLNIPYPDINGATIEERVSQINDYLGRYSSSVGNVYNNIGVDNLNPSLANRINNGLQRHQPLNEYAPITKVDAMRKPIENELKEANQTLDETSFTKTQAEDRFEPISEYNNYYTVAELAENFYQPQKLLENFYRIDEIADKNKLPLGYGVEGIKSKLKGLEVRIKLLELGI